MPKKKQPPPQTQQLPARPKAESRSVITETQMDSFQVFHKDPRLDASVYQLSKTHRTTEIRQNLATHFSGFKDEETFFDALRQHKIEEQEKIVATLETDPLKNRPLILKKLSALADNILFVAYQRLYERLNITYGLPCYLTSYKQTQPVSFALVSMGKLGGQEINYYSDLDLIFVYSHRGETIGKKQIDNGEYFVKLVQKLINTLSVLTAAGRCYQVDTELRPSGNTGTLVISYDHFLDHQMNLAQPWERQALIRARPLSEDWNFQNLLQGQINELTYTRPLVSDFTTYMHDIRTRVIQERARQINMGFDLKLGPGSIMDIEFILHHLQLKHGIVFKELRERSLFVLFGILEKHDCLTPAELKTLSQAYLYYRTIESLLHLQKKRAAAVITFTTDIGQDIAAKLNLTPEQLKDLLLGFQNDVKKIYDKFYLVK